MISVKELQGNIATMSRSIWLVSLGAISTVSQESKQIVEKVSQWNPRQSVVDLGNKYREVMDNLRERMGSMFNQIPVPKFAMAS